MLKNTHHPRRAFGLGILLVIFFVTAGAQAAYPLIIDDAGVHPPGEFELVLSGDGLRGALSDRVDTGFGLATGVARQLEFSLGFGYGWIKHRAEPTARWHNGADDFTIGLKQALLDEKNAPFSFTLSATSKLPVASDRFGLGTGFTDLNLLAIATRTWGTVSVDVNGGFTWTAVGRRTHKTGDIWMIGAALRWQAEKRLLLFVETLATLPADYHTTANGVVRGGWQVECVHNFFLGGAIGTGYGEGRSKGLASAGVTFVF